MEFAYYPGCSLECTSKPYDRSCREVFAALGITLREIEDWNCCGATMYTSVSKLIGYSVSARNLALAQNMGCDICAPCSSCYTILRKTNRYLDWDPRARAKINEALSAANLSYKKKVEIRHPLDILVNGIGVGKIAEAASFRFDGLRIAPYYGCQIVRPEYHFDDLDDPTSMNTLLEALGAEVVDYPSKVRCCGGLLMMTFENVALDLNHNLLQTAENNGAEVIATVCPLCHLNLEGYQSKINEHYGTRHNMPVVFFTQLVGLALGIDPKKLGLDALRVRLANPKLKSKKAVEVAA